jgi:hypothetical protein
MGPSSPSTGDRLTPFTISRPCRKWAAARIRGAQEQPPFSWVLVPDNMLVRTSPGIVWWWWCFWRREHAPHTHCVGAISSRSCRLFANSVQETAVANSSTNATTTTVIMVHEATWHPFLTTKRGSGTFSIICIRSLDSTSHDTP